MTTTEHVPERPSWDCLSCGKPWPCDPAREALVVELGPTPLAIYLWQQFEQAADELPLLSVSDGIERFLTWSRRPHFSPALHPQRTRQP